MSDETSIRIPKYRLHKPTGLAVVRLSGRDIYLGRFGTAESEARYQTVIADWLKHDRKRPSKPERPAARPDLVIDELILAYVEFALRYYVKNGLPTGETVNIKYSVAPLSALYGKTRVNDFGPMAMKATRMRMIEAKLCRSVVNSRLNRIRRMFKWAVENEMASPAVLQSLQAVAPLKRGRCEARESAGVHPAREELVDAVQRIVPRQIAAMIQLQRLTGMRPNEVTAMRTGDIDRTGPVWQYTPRTHKTEHHGRSRAIFLGPQAQAVVAPFLQIDPDAFLFSPRVVIAQLNREKRANRTTPMTPSQLARTPKLHPRKTAGHRYTRQSYAQAIAKACRRAFPPPADLPENRLHEWRRAHHWSPNQLRHNAATSLRKQFGIEAARLVLGHASADVTEIYAELDLAKAADIMGRVG